MLLICVRCVNDVDDVRSVACGSFCACCCHFMVIKIGFALNAINKTPEHFRWQMSSLKIMQRIETWTRAESQTEPGVCIWSSIWICGLGLVSRTAEPDLKRATADSDWRQVARSVRKFAALWRSVGISPAWYDVVLWAVLVTASCCCCCCCSCSCCGLLKSVHWGRGTLRSSIAGCKSIIKVKWF